jgi:hypothetical protein
LRDAITQSAIRGDNHDRLVSGRFSFDEIDDCVVAGPGRVDNTETTRLTLGGSRSGGALQDNDHGRVESTCIDGGE